MYRSNIQFTNNQKVFSLGGTITGTATVTVSQDLPLSSVSVSFHCRVGLKGFNVVDMLHYLNNYVYYQNDDILEQECCSCNDTSNDKTQVFMSSESESSDEPSKSKSIAISFSFTIPMDKELPSTIMNSEACVKYFICVTLKLRDAETKKFYNEVTVLAPFYKNLMITVAATAEKSVLLHSRTVCLHASIGRKGFAPGETITVHVTVHNQTNTAVVPMISLNQTQIYSSGSQLRIIENILVMEPIIGDAIGPHTKAEELLNVTIPEKELLSIKSYLITVKYFINVSLDIPHSFDLHVSLPFVVTSKTVIEQLHKRMDDQIIAH